MLALVIVIAENILSIFYYTIFLAVQTVQTLADLKFFFAHLYGLTINAPVATKNVCFSRLLKCLRNLMANNVDPDQTAPIGAVCSGSTLFASILN